VTNPNAKGRVENLCQFRKGQSGNTSGKAKPKKPEDVIKAAYDEAQDLIVADLCEAARRLTRKALKALEDVLDDPDCPRPVKITAAVHILDRGWGKPKESVEAKIEGRLDLEWLLNRGKELQQEREQQERERREREQCS
jgi:hypothetical protein